MDSPALAGSESHQCRRSIGLVPTTGICHPGHEPQDHRECRTQRWRWLVTQRTQVDLQPQEVTSLWFSVWEGAAGFAASAPPLRMGPALLTQPCGSSRPVHSRYRPREQGDNDPNSRIDRCTCCNRTAVQHLPGWKMQEHSMQGRRRSPLQDNLQFSFPFSVR